MEWKHEVSLEWMKARQNYLTASEIKSLIPFTKTGRPRKITDEDYAKVFINKFRHLTQEDCLSFGAAARGHILESYALRTFLESTNTIHLYHWDDMLIANDDLGIAYSPDALDFHPVGDCVIQDIAPLYLGEIKCYGPDRHVVTGMTDKEEIEERWQIATAMAASRSIEEAVLILYNPSLAHNFQMFHHHYFRHELIDEIDIVIDVAEKWNSWVVHGNISNNLNLINIPLCATFNSEEAIINDIEKENKLNP